MKLMPYLLSVFALVAGCASPIRGQLDEEVRRLCAIDGGIKVYETATLPAARFDRFGNVSLPFKSLAKAEDEYYFELERIFLRRGNPEMWRSEERIVRARDQKVMGRSISYTRRGGDAPSPMHESSYSCPVPETTPSLSSAIFLKGG